MLPTHFQLQGIVHGIGFTLPCLSHLIEKKHIFKSTGWITSRIMPSTDMLGCAFLGFWSTHDKSYKFCSSDDSLPQNHLTCNALTIVRYSAPLYIYDISWYTQTMLDFRTDCLPIIIWGYTFRSPEANSSNNTESFCRISRSWAATLPFQEPAAWPCCLMMIGDRRFY